MSNYTRYMWGGGGQMNLVDSYWEIDTISRIVNDRGTDLDDYMLCKTISSYDEEKEIDNLTSNILVNMQNLTTNTDKLLVCKQCANDQYLHNKIEEERYQEKLISYVDAYYDLSSLFQK